MLEIYDIPPHCSWNVMFSYKILLPNCGLQTIFSNMAS